MTTTFSDFNATKLGVIEEEIAKAHKAIAALEAGGGAPARDHSNYGRWCEVKGYLNAMETCRRFFSM